MYHTVLADLANAKVQIIFNITTSFITFILYSYYFCFLCFSCETVTPPSPLLASPKGEERSVVAKRLLFGRICNPAVLSLGICNPPAYSITNAFSQFCRISNPPEPDALTSHIKNSTEPRSKRREAGLSPCTPCTP